MYSVYCTLIVIYWSMKKAPNLGALEASLPSEPIMGLDQTHGKSLVTSGYNLAAGLAQGILSHGDAVASGATVGIHSKAMLANAAGFGSQIANAKTLASFGRGKGLATLQGLEHLKGLGFRIDKFHSKYLSKVKALLSAS